MENRKLKNTQRDFYYSWNVEILLILIDSLALLTFYQKNFEISNTFFRRGVFFSMYLTNKTKQPVKSVKQSKQKDENHLEPVY